MESMPNPRPPRFRIFAGASPRCPHAAVAPAPSRPAAASPSCWISSREVRRRQPPSHVHAEGQLKSVIGADGEPHRTASQRRDADDVAGISHMRKSPDRPHRLSRWRHRCDHRRALLAAYESTMTFRLSGPSFAHRRKAAHSKAKPAHRPDGRSANARGNPSIVSLGRTRADQAASTRWS